MGHLKIACGRVLEAIIKPYQMMPSGCFAPSTSAFGSGFWFSPGPFYWRLGNTRNYLNILYCSFILQPNKTKSYQCCVCMCVGDFPPFVNNLYCSGVTSHMRGCRLYLILHLIWAIYFYLRYPTNYLLRFFSGKMNIFATEALYFSSFLC